MASLHILVIEDHPTTNRVLTDLLRKRGHEVTSAGTAAAALQLGKKRLFDLAIVDIGLPDSDGWTLFAELKRLIPGLCAIAMTGYGFETDKQKSAAAGFAEHLTKPVQLATLEAAIARSCPELGYSGPPRESDGNAPFHL